MAQLLVINASPRGEESISRALTARFVETWQEAHPDGAVVDRDLGLTDVAHLDGAWIQATFVPVADRTPAMAEALLASDRLTAELVDADEVVIGTPMYNFGPPAVLKAWIDQVVRFAVTFTLDGGMLADKPVTVVVASREVFLPGSPMASGDFLSPYLEYIFAYMGVSDFRVVKAGDFFSLRIGRITREEHLARYIPLVDAAARQSSPAVAGEFS